MRFPLTGFRMVLACYPPSRPGGGPAVGKDWGPGGRVCNLVCVGACVYACQAVVFLLLGLPSGRILTTGGFRVEENSLPLLACRETFCLDLSFRLHAT